MKRFGLSLAIILCMALLASNAFANSLHKQSGDGLGSIGLGYSSLSLSTASSGNIALSGININWTRYYTDNLALSIKAAFLSGSLGTTSLTLNPFIIQAEWHEAFSDTFGYYVGLGYASSSGAVGNLSTRDTGITYEGGFERKFTDNITGHIGYQSVGLIGGSVNGISGGIDASF